MSFGFFLKSIIHATVKCQLQSNVNFNSFKSSCSDMLYIRKMMVVLPTTVDSVTHAGMCGYNVTRIDYIAGSLY
jgi:hypothetical protein